MVILCHCNQNFKGPFIRNRVKYGQMLKVLYTAQWDPVYTYYFLTRYKQKHQYANNKLKNGEKEGLVCFYLNALPGSKRRSQTRGDAVKGIWCFLFMSRL